MLYGERRVLEPGVVESPGPSTGDPTLRTDKRRDPIEPAWFGTGTGARLLLDDEDSSGGTLSSLSDTCGASPGLVSLVSIWPA